MPLDYDLLMSLPPEEVRQSYTARDTILYALGVAAGVPDPLDPGDLKYTYEADLHALPTMAVVLAYPGVWLMEPRFGITWHKVLHGEQTLRLHRPLPVEGTVVAATVIDAIYDKGADKGAVLYTRRDIRDAATGELLATVGQSAFLRGDGGFGGKADGAPKPHPVPDDRPPDLTLDLPTRPEQALIYRLSGDWNPLHVDPGVAALARFSRPILHGLCTYGVAGRAVLRLLCGNDPARLRRLDGRFSAPVFPGETIRTEIWHEGPGRAALRARVVERDLVVLTNGVVEWV
ncbi:MaoC/PaaZ C-terminal domain-containing protein [Rhodospirillum centenum]|uniref:MaoC-like dehydratase, putative n=1 Tax=Rhodospirillum centenum (strain ATCC 51521 / SW) TaxID=414684 RepID=B6IV90_RHOCS|nr:MaoC/PaaZ C-terminal domain-containing protein [Rhodospirillum centenum]ACJ00214.1 MaoC-like dehydratase, putative [Rhodospirillum centenum SW]